MITTSFTISAKKGDEQLTRWLIVQEIPYPCIYATSGSSGSFRWENGGGLFRYGRPAEGIGSKYYCHLLRSDIDVFSIPDNYNRTVFAGYMDYDTNSVAPGAVMLRGQSMGELTVRFEENPDWPRIAVRCTDSPSTGERKFITDQIVPKLKAAIALYKRALYGEAVEKLSAHIQKNINAARASIDKLQEEALAALKNLKA